MNHASRIFLTTCLSLLGVFAMGQSSNLGYSVGLKAGIGLFDEVYIEGADLNVTTKRFIYSASYNYLPELDILTPIPREYFNQANLLFGSFLANNSFRFEYQGGIGVVWGTRRTTFLSSGFLVDEYNSKEFETLGFPVKASAKYVPFQFMSVGLELLVNFNLEKSFAAPMVTLNFGRIVKEKNRQK